MSDKELVIDAVRRLPDEISLEEIWQEISVLAAIRRESSRPPDDADEEAAILEAIRRGEEAIAAGDVVSHDVVKRRSAAWISK